MVAVPNEEFEFYNIQIQVSYGCPTLSNLLLFVEFIDIEAMFQPCLHMLIHYNATLKFDLSQTFC